ncbi:MAG: Co2+/Mg2+ efflux protein ApaG [Gammaproteobacteria bacterium]|nr:Co2+/Mg2+ efflux protein ApaG [Gammaproteobacteria bacterium]MBU1447378.1 Co2+/Mg2+ efflux protein ApaG [Gammaproteobacteria bacterium]MDD2928977.1 Co2+/Mg2+ efflux protein ApaG [Sideroxydans sp.]MDD5471181.1 Co2+/Mg2+ efflux protein ApaG [Sideroxydans sp.]
MEDSSRYRVHVAVQVRHLAEQSDEADDRFVFSYTITIANQGPQPVQLLSRHWIITDANNHVQEVKGKGVVGEQPVIKPGEKFEYSSGTVLATQVGTMSGSYRMQVLDGGEFTVPVPQFVLSVPRTLH